MADEEKKYEEKDEKELLKHDEKKPKSTTWSVRLLGLLS